MTRPPCSSGGWLSSGLRFFCCCRVRCFPVCSLPWGRSRDKSMSLRFECPIIFPRPALLLGWIWQNWRFQLGIRWWVRTELEIIRWGRGIGSRFLLEAVRGSSSRFVWVLPQFFFLNLRNCKEWVFPSYLRSVRACLFHLFSITRHNYRVQLHYSRWKWWPWWIVSDV